MLYLNLDLQRNAFPFLPMESECSLSFDVNDRKKEVFLLVRKTTKERYSINQKNNSSLSCIVLFSKEPGSFLSLGNQIEKNSREKRKK